MNGKFGNYEFREIKRDKESIISLINDTTYKGDVITPSKVYACCTQALRMVLDDTKGTKRVAAYFENMNFNGFLMGGSYDKHDHSLRLEGEFDFNQKLLNILKKVKREYEGIFRFYNDKKLDVLVATKNEDNNQFYKDYEISQLKKTLISIDGIEIDIKSASHGNLFQLIYDKNIKETSGNPVKRLEKKY